LDRAVNDGSSRGTKSLNAKLMNRYQIILIALISLAITPEATAEIYRCDGPDGPIYSDKKCGPDATSVKFADTSGLTGVSDETKAELAARKAEREQASEEARKLNNNRTVINNQYTTLNTAPAGRWLNYPYPRPKPEKPPTPELRPTPLPGTLGRPRK